jgi:23S rRNA (guanosine2251-2'-O)-methyltransferase
MVDSSGKIIKNIMKKLLHAEIADNRLTEEEAAKVDGRFPLIAILDNIRSMYNVGSIFRTSDGARIEAIYTVGYTPHPPRKEIEKTALDATRTVPHRHFALMSEAIAACKEQGMKIAALELTDNSKSVFDLTANDFPMALIVGNEITGVSDEALSLCDLSISIPMYGAKHSLNVAVAYGVAVFECIRAKSG